MPTLVRDPQPVEFKALLERRRKLGQDLLDEVWEGVYHVNPAPHLRHAYMVQQIAETWQKLDFYAAHCVDELLIVDPQARQVHWLGLGSGGEYSPIGRSGLVDLGAAELADRIDWPQ